MVREEDPPGIDKHLRFGHYTEALSALLVGFPGVKSIVLHTHGAKGEHPHLHVWWSGEKQVTNQTVRNRLKKYDPAFMLMSGQNAWSFRNHDSFENWASYVQENKTHKVLLGELPPPKDTIMLDIPNTPATMASSSLPAPVKIIRRKPNAEERLINYCRVEIGMIDNQWGLAHYELGTPYRKKMQKDAARAVTTACHGRLHNNQLLAGTRNVMWTFADEDLKEALVEQWMDSIEKYL